MALSKVERAKLEDIKSKLEVLKTKESDLSSKMDSIIGDMTSNKVDLQRLKEKQQKNLID